MPRITVLLPVYNSERYLSEAIQSLLYQTFDGFEVLLLNDGSSDGSMEIAEDAAAKDSRIVVVNGTRHGYVYWLNTGLNMARGELIARMDADDICYQNLAKQVRFLDAHAERCVVGTQAIRIDSEGAPIKLIGGLCPNTTMISTNCSCVAGPA
jgi:glycosyltransferase involved in cell wall biosynthesis